MKKSSEITHTRQCSFPATIPPTETAIKIHGEGGARLQLDIAETDLAAFLPALAFRGVRLTVTLEEVT
jgi:hypothetical protein